MPTERNDPPFDCPNCYGRPLGQCPFCGTIGPERAVGPPSDPNELPEAVRRHEEIVRQMLRARCVP